MTNKKKNLLSAASFLTGFAVCLILAPAENEVLRDGAAYSIGLNDYTILKILLSNSFMCLMLILACGYLSCVILFVQGLQFGGTYIAWAIMGNDRLSFWLLFAPHVILEFIAMILASYIGFQFFDWIRNRNKTIKAFIYHERWCIATTFSIVIVAALVECFVTPLLFRAALPS